MAGRKAIQVENPFVMVDEDGHVDFTYEEDEFPTSLEEILVGCIRSFTAESKTKQEFVHWYKLRRVYLNLDTLTGQTIQTFLMCSRAQANRYMQVIRLANMFIERHMKNQTRWVKGYVDLTESQVKAGYLEL